MPVQTTKTDYIFFPDGAVVAVQDESGGSWYDVGAINSSVTNTLEYDENQVETANAGKTSKQIRNMRMSGGFTLINLQAEGINKMSGGMFSITNVAGGAISDVVDLTVSSGWEDGAIYPLTMNSTANGSVRTSSAPVLTSVTLNPDGTPETLTAGTDYVVVADSRSPSGWGITFISANMSTESPTTYDIEVVFGSNTPVARTTMTGGSSTIILNAYALKITHTDSNGLVRELELYAVNPTSGGFQFNFKGANEDGVEEMPLTFEAILDSTRTDKDQLFSWRVDSNAA